MPRKLHVAGFLLVVVLPSAGLAQAPGNYINGQTLWDASGCEGCHDYVGATGLQAVRDQIAQRTTPVPGLNFSKSLMALNAALSGTDLSGDITGMDATFPPGTFNTAQIADLATYISNMPTPTPLLTHLPFPGPVFPPTAVGATNTQIVTVTNSGTAPLVFAANGAAQIASGPYAGDYSVTGAQCQAITLQPNEGSCTVTVQFRPSAGAEVGRTAALALLTATSAAPTLVPLFGALPAAAAAAPPTGPPAATPAPSGSANAPSSGGALPWQLVGVLLIALIPGVRRAIRSR